MKKTEFVSLIVRLMGVFYLVTIAPGVIGLVYVKRFSSLLPIMIPHIFVLVISVSLIVFSRQLARIIVSGPETSEVIPSHLSISDWQAVLFSGVGVLTMANGVRWLTKIMNFTTGEIQPIMLIPGLVTIAIGAALFLQSRGLANLWTRFQDMRRLEVDSDEKGHYHS